MEGQPRENREGALTEEGPSRSAERSARNSDLFPQALQPVPSFSLQRSLLRSPRRLLRIPAESVS